MSSKAKPSSVPKNAIRYAIITATAISTLIGAQTIAFSEELAQLQLQAQREQAVTLVVDNNTLGPTLVPTSVSTVLYTEVNTVADDPTTVVVPTLVTPISAQPNPAGVKLPTAQPTLQPTVQPTVQLTATQVTVQPTQSTVQVVPAVNQPRPRTQSSKP